MDLIRVYRSSRLCPEEKWNCITHAAGILVAACFIPLMIRDAFRLNDGIQLFNIILYSASFASTFICSTIFHALAEGRAKTAFRKADELCIYLLIAATYLPLIHKYMNTSKGDILLLLVWAFVPLGAFFIGADKIKRPLLTVSGYAAQGLMFILFCRSFFAEMPLHIIQVIIAGIGCILLGIFFFLRRNWKYHHALWHLLVLCGNILFFFAIWESL